MMKDGLQARAPLLTGTKAKLQNRLEQGQAAIVPNNSRGAQAFKDVLLKTERSLLKIQSKIGEDQPASGSVGAGAVPLPFATTQPPSSTTASAPSLAADRAAHLERMAAAIAEVNTSGATAEVHVTLPKGAIPVEGATIGRNEAGALHIMLTSTAPIAPAQAAMLQASLQDRLRARDVRVGRISFQKTDRAR